MAVSEISLVPSHKNQSYQTSLVRIVTVWIFHRVIPLDEVCQISTVLLLGYQDIPFRYHMEIVSPVYLHNLYRLDQNTYYMEVALSAFLV